MRRRIAALLLALLTAGLTVPGSAEKESQVGYYFNTAVTITVYDPPAGVMDELLTACGDYERMLSKTVEGSDVWRVNHAGGAPVTVSPETMGILREALAMHQASDGAFCITLAPVVDLWGFTDGSNRMPAPGEVSEALTLVDDAAVQLDGDTVTLPAGRSIDLGGIAKGYIADAVAALLREHGLNGLLNFGGNIYGIGAKPDGSAWRIGVRDPQGSESDAIAVLSVIDQSVVTSGIYERYVEVDGVRWHHILNPETGYSADSDLASATIVNSSSMNADAAATACIVLGSEKALALLDRLGYDGLLITREGEILTTPGFAEAYNLVIVP